MTTAQRKIAPCCCLIAQIGLSRPWGHEETYLCLQCRQRILDLSEHGTSHGFCHGCGRCFTGVPAGGFYTDNPLIVGSDHRLCGNCYWRLSVPCGCACGCSQARLPTFRLCRRCNLSSHPVCGYILGGHLGAALVWERHVASERQREGGEAADVRERAAERPERWRNAGRAEREAVLSERWEARKWST